MLQQELKVSSRLSRGDFEALRLIVEKSRINDWRDESAYSATIYALPYEHAGQSAVLSIGWTIDAGCSHCVAISIGYISQNDTVLASLDGDQTNILLDDLKKIRRIANNCAAESAEQLRRVFKDPQADLGAFNFERICQKNSNSIIALCGDVRVEVCKSKIDLGLFEFTRYAARIEHSADLVGTVAVLRSAEARLVYNALNKHVPN